jgi:hypothetical protein
MPPPNIVLPTLVPPVVAAPPPPLAGQTRPADSQAGPDAKRSRTEESGLVSLLLLLLVGFLTVVICRLMQMSGRRV